MLVQANFRIELGFSGEVCGAKNFPTRPGRILIG